MPQRVRVLFLAPFLVGLVAACGGGEGDERLVVAAASSLRDLLGEVEPGFRAAHPGIELSFSFDASSTLARQIAAGGRFDVLLSADEETLRHAGDRVDPRTGRLFLGNRLALVARAGLADAPSTPGELGAVAGTLAMAGPAVPAGRYARSHLEELGILEALEGRIVEARTARATLALVQSGAVDLGLVYATDARAASDLSLLWTAAAGEGPKVAYVAVAVAGAAPSAATFLEWLASADFLRVAERHGFRAPGA